jgi:voltage-gated potassium channel
VGEPKSEGTVEKSQAVARGLSESGERGPVGEPVNRDGRKVWREPKVRYAIYELFIFALTVFSLLTLGAYYLLPLSEATQQAIVQSDFVISLVFLADSVRSLVRAPSKKAYLKWGWLDFLGSIPAVLPLRFLRVFRLGRSWRTIRQGSPRIILREFQARRANSALLMTGLVAIITVTLVSVIVLELENGAPGASIRTGGDAFWWAVVTLATVGYGDLYPVTSSGRLAALVLIIVGVGLFGVMTSYLASVFVESDRRRDRARQSEERAPRAAAAPDSPAQSELALLREDVASLEKQVTRLRDDFGSLVEALEDRD